MEIEREQVERDEEGKPVEGAEPATVRTLDTLNSMKAIWLKEKDEVSEEELGEFEVQLGIYVQGPLVGYQNGFNLTLENRTRLEQEFRPYRVRHRGHVVHGRGVLAPVDRSSWGHCQSSITLLVQDHHVVIGVTLGGPDGTYQVGVTLQQQPDAGINILDGPQRRGGGNANQDLNLAAVHGVQRANRVLPGQPLG